MCGSRWLTGPGSFQTVGRRQGTKPERTHHFCSHPHGPHSATEPSSLQGTPGGAGTVLSVHTPTYKSEVLFLLGKTILGNSQEPLPELERVIVENRAENPELQCQCSGSKNVEILAYLFIAKSHYSSP